jgi:UDP-N-acetylglucosamine acyltransferase
MRNPDVATIHPSSIVDQRVELAEDVSIGPGCIIEGRVTIGAGCRLLGHVCLKGPLTLGRGNTIYPFAALGFEPQDRKYKPDHEGSGVVIGEDNIIREGVTIHRATGAQPTTVGNRNYLMCYCHLGHDSRVGNDCVIANGVLLAGHVELHDRVTMGGAAVVHQFCRIGRLAMQSGACGVVQDVPPFCVVYQSAFLAGINIVGLRRAGLRQHIKTLETAFRLLFKERRAMNNALLMTEQQLGDDPLVAEMIAFIRGSKRGICHYYGRRKGQRSASDLEPMPDTAL